jgi:hypothetical protein
MHATWCVYAGPSSQQIPPSNMLAADTKADLKEHAASSTETAVVAGTLQQAKPHIPCQSQEHEDTDARPQSSSCTGPARPPDDDTDIAQVVTHRLAASHASSAAAAADALEPMSNACCLLPAAPCHDIPDTINPDTASSLDIGAAKLHPHQHLSAPAPLMPLCSAASHSWSDAPLEEIHRLQQMLIQASAKQKVRHSANTGQKFSK